MYRTGGLEPVDHELKTMSVDGVEYIVSDKFKTMLRDSFIDWGTFLEVYHDNLTYANLFDQMVRLLNIKENENLRDVMVPLVKKIYHLPAKAHMACMLKQFMIYEPVSVAIHSLFTTIKIHYESVVDQFLLTRNRYILQHETKDALNDLEELKKYWEDLNLQYNLETSSIKLLFLNPPKGLKSKLNFNVSGMEQHIAKLRDAVKHFKYAGFCPKVPYVRLKALLGFPINQFIAAIKAMDPAAKFPDYKSVEKLIAKAIVDMPAKPAVPDDVKRESPPPGLTDKLELGKWYINAILDLRKDLLKYGNAFEDYYSEQAKILININEIVKKEFLLSNVTDRM
jgi:hypothetical protein